MGLQKSNNYHINYIYSSINNNYFVDGESNWNRTDTRQNPCFYLVCIMSPQPKGVGNILHVFLVQIMSVLASASAASA